MPVHIHEEIPQQRSLGKSVEPEKVLEKAAGILNCDLDDIRRLWRIPKSIKDDRDLLVYLHVFIPILPNLIRAGQSFLPVQETERVPAQDFIAVAEI